MNIIVILGMDELLEDDEVTVAHAAFDLTALALIHRKLVAGLARAVLGNHPYLGAGSLAIVAAD